MIQTEIGRDLHETYDDDPLLRASERLKCFLEGLRSLTAEELVTFFAAKSEFIDAAGKRWTLQEIEKGYEALFAGYAKKNATFVVEGTPAQMDDVYIAMVLWKNALLASEERSSMHRMAVILVREKRDWNIALVQVTPVKPSSAAAI